MNNSSSLNSLDIEKNSLLNNNGNTYQNSPPMTYSSTVLSRKKTSSCSLLDRKKCNVMTLLVIAAVGAVSFLYYSGCFEQPTTTQPNTPSPEDENSRNPDLSNLKEAYTVNSHPVLSNAHPESIGYPTFMRWAGTPGAAYGTYLAQGVNTTGISIPTNRWYQNILLGGPKDEFGSIYTIPYIVDTAGSIPGLRIQYPNLQASTSIVQMIFNANFGLTLGVDNKAGISSQYILDDVSQPSELGVTLKWPAVNASVEGDSVFLRSPIVRGMPYSTMEYSAGLSPLVHSTDLPMSPPVADSKTKLTCDGTITHVQREVSIHFRSSDFTYLVFFSRPVDVVCETFEGKPPPFVPGVVQPNSNHFTLSVVDNSTEQEPMVLRAAVGNNCTSGYNPIFCENGQARDNKAYMDTLREHAEYYPMNPFVKYSFPTKEDLDSPVGTADLFFNWDMKKMSNIQTDISITMESRVRNKVLAYGPGFPSGYSSHFHPSSKLLMFALPHHRQILTTNPASANSEIGFCHPTLHGEACLVLGGEWTMAEDLGSIPSALAPRPPKAFAISALAKAIEKDIFYTPDKNFMIGAGDTYFSGKMLARLARIIAITKELKSLQTYSSRDIKENDQDGSLHKIVHECKRARLPSDDVIDNAVERLKQGVEIWFNGTAEAIFTYDGKYGGLVSCGCDFNEGTRHCRNRYPNCPGYDNAGMNFGNGFYNDHHFHYGYHIYAAAIASSYDHEWGKKYFQNVLAYIRDIANPSTLDDFFPTFRHKDWYLGSSWASGIATIGGHPYPNGRNQESSSEAIAAYEAIGLYGETMTTVFLDSSSDDDFGHAITSSRVRDLGRLLTATELRSAKTYWHSMPSDTPGRLYPAAYSPPAVGMLWSTMAQFQTWFGSAPYLPIGIQLLPITPVSEERDTIAWSKAIYGPFHDSCSADEMCLMQGWSILEYCVLAEIGHPALALEETLKIPEGVFESAGGDGHSMTNTIWYISTRPEVSDIYPLTTSPPTPPSHAASKSSTEVSTPSPVVSHKVVTDCGLPKSCTWKVLDSDAKGFTCKARIEWVMNNMSKNETEACHQVSGIEYPSSCGGCDPIPSPPSTQNVTTTEDKVKPVEYPDNACLPCSTDVCQKDPCPPDGTWYMCTAGPAKDGCASKPWLQKGQTSTACSTCCTLTPECGDS